MQQHMTFVKSKNYLKKTENNKNFNLFMVNLFFLFVILQ